MCTYPSTVLDAISVRPLSETDAGFFLLPKAQQLKMEARQQRNHVTQVATRHHNHIESHRLVRMCEASYALTADVYAPSLSALQKVCGMYIGMCVCIYVCVCVYMYMYVCI